MTLCECHAIVDAADRGAADAAARQHALAALREPARGGA